MKENYNKLDSWKAVFLFMIGDIAIMSYRNVFHKKKNMHLMYGVIAFCLAHMTYITIMTTFMNKLLLYVAPNSFVFLVASLFFNSERKVKNLIFFYIQ